MKEKKLKKKKIPNKYKPLFILKGLWLIGKVIEVWTLGSTMGPKNKDKWQKKVEWQQKS